MLQDDIDDIFGKILRHAASVMCELVACGREAKSAFLGIEKNALKTDKKYESQRHKKKLRIKQNFCNE